MNRDKEIQKIFETADDSLQGIIGYHMYVAAMENAADYHQIMTNLPDQQFQMTFSWIRYYSKQTLLEAFKPPKLELYQSKILLVAMTGVFEASLVGFVEALDRRGFQQHLPKRGKRPGYKDYLRWAYDQASKCDIGDKHALGRLPQTFGMIDNARRLRNLIVHCGGLFDQIYERDVLSYKDIVVDLHSYYEQFKRNLRKAVPVIIDRQYFHRLMLAHIEVLHILHNRIQEEYFEVLDGYSYRREQKPIDWERVLWGKAKVQILQREMEKSSNTDSG